MLASLNLLALLSLGLLGLVLGDRTIRAVAAIILLGVLSTIFVQRITDSFAPGTFLLIVDAFMWAALFVVCGNSSYRWCWAVLAVQTLVVANTAGHAVGFEYRLEPFSSEWIYMVVTAALSYFHCGLIGYALLDRYLGAPLAPPQTEE